MIEPVFNFTQVLQVDHGDTVSMSFFDCDRRRWFELLASPECVPPASPEDEEEDVGVSEALDVLKRYHRLLSPKVNAIQVDEKGLLVSVSCGNYITSPTAYPSMSSSAHLKTYPTIDVRDLVEIDRLYFCVDRVAPKSNPDKGVVFKYALFDAQAFRMWREVNILSAIAPHPNILPLKSLITDGGENDPRLLGFTTEFIPGGTLVENTSRRFKLKWLNQLISAVDFLNMEMGVVNNDISPKNLLIDPSTDNLKLFDFNAAATVAEDGSAYDLAGVILTMYEIVTHDFDFRDDNRRVWPENAIEVTGRKEWPVRGRLGCKVTTIRKRLVEWSKVQRTGGGDGPVVPPFVLAAADEKTQTSEVKTETDGNKHTAEWDFNCWERPAQMKTVPSRRKRKTDSQDEEIDTSASE